MIFAGWFYFSNLRGEGILRYEAEKEKIASVAVVDEQKNSFDKDADSDGLKDWEELLWKTDPNKKDTDGDGTNDGDEIALGRNPLMAGPNDKISDKEDLVAQEKAAADSGYNTETAVSARQFMADFLALKQQKGTLSDEDKNNLVGKFMENIKPLAVVDKYNISDIKITKDTSESSVTKYAEQMKALFIDTKAPRVSELDIFDDLMKNIKADDVKKIESNINGLNLYAGWNEQVSKVVLLFTVPESLSKSHLEIANGYNNIKIAADNMAIAKNDPVKAMRGQKLYLEQKQRIYSAIKDIQEIFNKYEIAIFK